MRLWLSRSSEVPLRDQLEAQIILGILSDDLKAGQRLPSTRELARRYKIHSNTVSAAYRRLAAKGWVQFRKGSGIYVRALAKDQLLDAHLELDQLIAVCLKMARSKGFSLREIQSRLRHWLTLQPPDHFLVIEREPGLREIIMTEIEEATGVSAAATTLEDPNLVEMLTGAAPVALYSQAEKVRAALPLDVEILTLRSRSIPESLQGQTRPSPESLIAIVSCWPEFLNWARTILVAAGLDPNGLSFRDARERGWHRGLGASAFVVTDSVMVRKLPAGCQPRVFRVLADASIGELQHFTKQFIGRQAAP